jgi:hypothetical protein
LLAAVGGSHEELDRLRLDVVEGLSAMRTPGFFRFGLHKRGLLGRLAAWRTPTNHARLIFGFRRYVFPWAAAERSKEFYTQH